jgi:hypothetical protein
MERIGPEIEKTLAASGGGAVVALAEIATAWPEAVGEAVSRQAWPLRLGRDGTLHVATSSATWAFELDRLAPEIQEQLAAALGPSAPVKLRFRVGPVPEHGQTSDEPAATSGEPLRTSPETASAAEAAAGEIEDPELREIVEKAARASLSRARSDRFF